MMRRKAFELLRMKYLKPAGATIDIPALCQSRPNISPQTSRKVIKALKSLGGANTEIYVLYYLAKSSFYT